MSREILHAGKFISRGKGKHITRVMDSCELIVVLSGELNMFEEERYFRIHSGEYKIVHKEPEVEEEVSEEAAEVLAAEEIVAAVEEA